MEPFTRPCWASVNDEIIPRNARLREVGTKNLVDACVAAGVSHVIAQSIAFAYAPGPQPCTEDAPLNLHAEDPVAARTARAALLRGDAGIYNVAEPNGTVSIARAVGLLGWSPAFRERGAG